jgi:acyl-CoA synthetase (AMP-forming)/AMP-acid ligase II
MNENQIFSQIKEKFFINDQMLYVGSLLQRAGKAFGNKTALIADEKTITYKEFYFRAVLLSKKLQAQGVTSKERVILYFENSLEFYVAYFAIWQLGAVVVPINIFLHEKELSYIIKDCGACFAIVSDTLKDKWQSTLPIFSQADFDWHTPVPQDLQDIYSSFDLQLLDPYELCLLLYTSGTTGMPKGVMLCSHNIMTNLMQCYARLQMFGQRDNDIFFSVLPLFHVFAQNVCLWLPVMVGASVIIVKKN